MSLWLAVSTAGRGMLTEAEVAEAAGEDSRRVRQLYPKSGVDLGYILYFTSDSKGSKQYNTHSITGPKSNHEVPCLILKGMRILDTFQNGPATLAFSKQGVMLHVGHRFKPSRKELPGFDTCRWWCLVLQVNWVWVC